MYQSLLKPLLFLLSPEKAHYFTVFLLKVACAIPGIKGMVKSMGSYEHPKLARNLFGLDFPGPVGLAAGFDKHAKTFNEMHTVGFDFVEVGTVTPLAQPGNPKPRLFRLPKDNALINRMGFNNHGMVAVAERLRKRKAAPIIGGNIGKNKVTPAEEALNDYVKCFNELYPVVDYFVINVSSPNTPGLRDLQRKEHLQELVGTVMKANQAKESQKPVFLKIAPDVDNAMLDDFISIVNEEGLAGIIATNTTIDRSELKTSKEQIEAIGAGGLSGKPVTARSTEVIRYIHEKSGGKIPIIGVGGIHSAQDAIEKLKAGACLIQLYTGFIYEGPKLIKEIKKAIVKEGL